MRIKSRSRIAPLAFVVLTACATANHSPVVSGPSANIWGLQQGQGKIALARAESAYRAGSYPLAADLYEWVVTHDSSPPSIALVRLATLRSWDNHLDEAFGLYRQYLRQEPADAEGSLALARTLAWGGHYDSAITIYDSLITARKRLRDATVDRAQTL